MQKLDATYKWGLTGTPMQNRPDEIFNVFSFINPKVLGNMWGFRKKYIVIGDAYGKHNVPLGYKNLDELHTKLSPYMLRRLKKDVAPELPEIIYTTRYVEMSKDQGQLHEIVYNDFQELMRTVDTLIERDEYGDIIKKPATADSALGYFILMQEIADSMDLLNMSNSKMVAKYNIVSQDSPKLDELYEICKERLESNPSEKIVIFTQFERMQKLIIKKLAKLGKASVLNGKMNSKQKQQSKDDFINNNDVRFFLSTDSGNFGLNLSIASCLISVDIPWNPGVFLQRAARIHRINSTFDHVDIITLLSKKSIDEIIYSTMYKKIKISNQVVEYTDEEKDELNKATLNQLKFLATWRK